MALVLLLRSYCCGIHNVVCSSAYTFTHRIRPHLDQDRLLHWPVVIIYPENMQQDAIEDFCETQTVAAHLDVVSCSSFAVQPIPVLGFDTSCCVPDCTGTQRISLHRPTVLTGRACTAVVTRCNQGQLGCCGSWHTAVH